MRDAGVSRKEKSSISALTTMRGWRRLAGWSKS
jgi:hypothetical protein